MNLQSVFLGTNLPRNRDRIELYFIMRLNVEQQKEGPFCYAKSRGCGRDDNQTEKDDFAP